MLLLISVTRLGDLLDSGQLFKAFGNNVFAQIAHILRQRCQNLSFFLWIHFWAIFIDIWRFFSGHIVADVVVSFFSRSIVYKYSRFSADVVGVYSKTDIKIEPFFAPFESVTSSHQFLLIWQNFQLFFFIEKHLGSKFWDWSSDGLGLLILNDNHRALNLDYFSPDVQLKT